MISMTRIRHRGTIGDKQRTVGRGIFLACLLLRSCFLLECTSSADPKAAPARSPAANRKPLSKDENAALAEHLKQALDEGYIVGPKRLHEAQKKLALARRVAPTEPRIDFANGLVLVKQGQLKLAKSQFEAALSRDGAAYWPAWQAAIWAHLADKQYEQGLKRLIEFAAIVKNAEPPDEISEAQREAARWVGQILEVLAQVPESRKFDDHLAKYQVKVLNVLGDQLSESLEEGRELIRDRRFELDHAAGIARRAADRKKALRHQYQSEQLEKGFKGAEQERDSVKKTEDEWEKELDEMLEVSEKQLKRLDRDYQFLEKKSQSIMQSYTLAGTQLTALNLNIHPATSRNVSPQATFNLQQQIIATENQMLGYQQEYEETQGRMALVAQRGQQILRMRADAITRYQDATGDFIKKKADLGKWVARMKAEKQHLAAQLPATKKTAAEKQQPFSLRSILNFDLEREKMQLLASFEPTHFNDEGHR
jgi:hypothetical protein